MNQQTRVGGTEEAGLDLSVIITGSEWLTAAQVVTWTVPGQVYSPITVDTVNPFTYLRPVYDPMVSGASTDGKTWYGAADPALLPGIVYGFIAGSFFIGCSQFWKVGRIMTTTKDITAVGVELNPGLGAWCFFVGTMMYNNPYYLEHYYGIIVNIWEVGSVLFTMGALFLTFRHFVMGVA
jgi:hypothetical protein